MAGPAGRGSSRGPRYVCVPQVYIVSGAVEPCGKKQKQNPKVLTIRGFTYHHLTQRSPLKTDRTWGAGSWGSSEGITLEQSPWYSSAGVVWDITVMG